MARGAGRWARTRGAPRSHVRPTSPAPQLHLAELPEQPAEGYEGDEEFLRKLHHVLLEVTPHPPPGAGVGVPSPPAPLTEPPGPCPRRQVEVLEGTLQCPESGRLFPISRGIPNMLLNDEETEAT